MGKQKPKFDPSKPYEEVEDVATEVVGKPKFDPSKPFTVVEKKSEDESEVGSKDLSQPAKVQEPLSGNPGVNSLLVDSEDSGTPAPVIKPIVDPKTQQDKIDYLKQVEIKQSLKTPVVPGDNLKIDLGLNINDKPIVEAERISSEEDQKEMDAWTQVERERKNLETNPFVSFYESAKNTLVNELPGTLAAAHAALKQAPGGGVDKDDKDFLAAKVWVSNPDGTGEYITRQQYHDRSIKQHEEQKEALLKFATEKLDEASKVNVIRSLDDVHDPLDLLNFITSAIGQSGVQIPLNIATAGVAGAGQEIGGAYMDGINEVAQKENITPLQVIQQGKDEKVIPIISGLIAGSLDYIGAKGVAKTINVDELTKSLRKRAIAFIGGMAKEALTEGAQGVVTKTGTASISHDNIKDIAQKVWDERMDIVDEMAAGFFGAGGVQTVGAGANSLIKSDVKTEEKGAELTTQQENIDNKVNKNANTEEVNPQGETTENILQQQVPVSEESATAKGAGAIKEVALNEKKSDIEQMLEESFKGNTEILNGVIVAYHGDTGKPKQSDAVYLSNKETAESYGEETGNVKKNYVFLKNPYNVKKDADFDLIQGFINEHKKENPDSKWHPDTTGYVNKKLKELGYDGLNIEQSALDSGKGYEEISGTYGDPQIIAFDKNSVIEDNPKAISEAYYKAKKNGSNPELVKAVEEAINKKQEVVSDASQGEGVALKEAKPIDVKQDKMTKLKALMDDYNTSNNRDRTSEKLQQIKLLAREELGFTVDQASSKGQVVIPEMKNFRIKNTETDTSESPNFVPLEKRSDKAKEFIGKILNIVESGDENILQAISNPLTGQAINLSKSVLKGAIKDIREGKNTIRAQRVMDILDPDNNGGEIGVSQGSGFLIQKASVPIDEYIKGFAPKEIESDEDVDNAINKNPEIEEALNEFTDENGDIDFDAIQEKFDSNPEFFTTFPLSLSEDQVNTLKNISYEKRATKKENSGTTQERVQVNADTNQGSDSKDSKEKIIDSGIPPATPVESTQETEGKGPKKKSYETRQLKKFADSKILTDAVKENGLEYEPITWKRVNPIADAILSEATADESTSDKNLNELRDQISETTGKDYINNPDLSTLHSLLFHKIIDHYQKIGNIEQFKAWSNDYSNQGRYKGQFISAMQHDSSPEAIGNKVMNMLLSDKAESMESHSEEIKAIQEKLKLTEGEVKRLQEIVKEISERPLPESSSPVTKSDQIKKKRSAALGKINAALKRVGRQTNAAGPLNIMFDAQMLTGVKELIETFIEEGIYKAKILKARVLKEIGDKELKKQISDNWDQIFDSGLKNKALTVKAEKFVEKLETRGKANLGTKKAKEAEDVLLNTLIAKVNETLPKEKKGKPVRVNEIVEGIRNKTFADDVWQKAMNNIKTWLDGQNIPVEKKAEIIANLEDSISDFMETPFSNSHLREEIRSGVKDIGVEVSKVVKEHWTKQNSTAQTLAEKLIYKLGLTPEEAAIFDKRITQEVAKIFEETRIKEIHKTLNLDKDGNKKERIPVNNRIVDQIIKAINLGLLTDSKFQDFFAEKYGFTHLTTSDITQIKRFNDLINLHQGSEMSRRYMKEMMDYIQHLKPTTAESFFNAIQTLTIRAILTGINTNAVNIPIGSYFSHFANSIPLAIANPVAWYQGMKSFKEAGLSGVGRKTFLDIMKSNYNILDEETKFDDRKDTRGDVIDYMINNYDAKKFTNKVRDAKTPKERLGALATLVGRSYLQTYKLANFAKAFDVLISHKAEEMDMFIQEYKDQRKLLGKNSFMSRFDPSTVKQITEAVKKKMAYDEPTKTEIQENVKQEILEMKGRGEPVPPGFEQRRIKERMQEFRDTEKVKRARVAAKTAILMGELEGMGGAFNQWVSKGLALNEKDTYVSGLAKTSTKLTLGLFLRISTASIQRAIENVPLAGLVAPGIFYDYKRVLKDPLQPKGDHIFEWKVQDAKIRNQRLLVHAMATGIFGAAAMAMFEWDDEDKKLKLRKDRWIDITGFSENEKDKGSLNDDGSINERTNYTISVKIGDKWHNIIPARLVPHLLPLIAILGGMRDEALMEESKFNDKEVMSQITSHLGDIGLALTQQSFATAPKMVKTLTFAGMKEGVGGVGKELMFQAISPYKATIYPNILKDVYNEAMSFAGGDVKTGSPIDRLIAKDIAAMEDMLLVSKTDCFGFPIQRSSKIISSLQTNPAANIIVDNLIDFKNINDGRYNQKAWQLKMKYQPNAEIKAYWAKGKSMELKQIGAEAYGVKMRELFMKHEGTLKSKSAEDFQETYIGSDGIWHKVAMNAAKIEIRKAEKLIN